MFFEAPWLSYLETKLFFLILYISLKLLYIIYLWFLKIALTGIKKC